MLLNLNHDSAFSSVELNRVTYLRQRAAGKRNVDHRSADGNDATFSCRWVRCRSRHLAVRPVAHVENPNGNATALPKQRCGASIGVAIIPERFLQP